MRSCGNCGHACDTEERFCPSCHTYLGWTETQTLAIPALTNRGPTVPPHEERAHSPVRPTDAPPSRAPDPVPDRAEVSLTLSSAALEVEPGDTAATTVVVKNHGTRVDEFVVTIDGAARPWATVDPPQVAVYPGAEEAVTVTFAPPRQDGVPAGQTRFAVVARSALDAGAGAREEGTIDVAPLRWLTVDVAPDRQRATRSAGYHVLLRNRGNADALVRLRPGGAHHELDLRLEPDRLLVPAFGAATGDLHLTAPGKELEESRVALFQVEAVTDEDGQESSAGTAEVCFVQEPEPPSPRYLATVVGWLVGGLLVGVLLAALAVGAVLGVAELGAGNAAVGDLVIAGVAGGAAGVVVGSMLGIRRALRPRKAVRIGLTCLLVGILTLLWLAGLLLGVRAGSVPGVLVLVLANPAVIGRWLALRGMPQPPPAHAPAPARAAPVDRTTEHAPAREQAPARRSLREAPDRTDEAGPARGRLPEPEPEPRTERPSGRARTVAAIAAAGAGVLVLAVLLLGLPGTTTTGLNVRVGPGVENPLNGDPLPPGALVTVRCQARPGWVAISLPRPGYVAARFLDYPGARPCLGDDGGF